MQKLNLHSFRAVRALTFLGGLFGFLSTSDFVQGAVILKFTDTSGDNRVDLVPVANDPNSFCFTFTVSVETTESTSGLTFRLMGPLNPNQDPGNLLDDGLFRIVARNAAGSVYPLLSQQDTELFNIPSNTVPSNAVLDPTNTRDLAGTTNNGAPDVPPSHPTGQAPGPDYFVETLTLCAVSTILPGEYTIESFIQSATTGGDPEGITVAPATYKVNVIPEPGAACLLCLGGTLFGLARRKRAA